jgi:hypothetical protein
MSAMLIVAAGCDTRLVPVGLRDAPGEETDLHGGEDHPQDADTSEDVRIEAEAEIDIGPDDGGETATLTVAVTGPSQWPDYGSSPVAGAAVAFDAPGGGRFEAATDGEGRVAFEGVDWSLGRGAVTAWAEGYGLASRVGLDGSAAQTTLSLPDVREWPRPGCVELSGRSLNLPEHFNVLTVLATVPSRWFHDVPPGWSIAVPSATPFTIVANASGPTTILGQLHGYDRTEELWLTPDHDAIDAPATMDLDFAAPLPTTTVSGSFPVPPREDSPLREGAGEVYVQWNRLENGHGTFESLANIGYCKHIETAADGNAILYDIRSPSVTDNLDPSSSAWIEGYPTSGAQDVALLDCPRMIQPAEPIIPYALHEPIEWELFDVGVQVELQIIRENETATPLTELWSVWTETDAGSLTVPEPPVAADVAGLLGTGTVQARLKLVSLTPGEPCYRRIATSGRFALIP